MMAGGLTAMSGIGRHDPVTPVRALVVGASVAGAAHLATQKPRTITLVDPR